MMILSVLFTILCCVCCSSVSSYTTQESTDHRLPRTLRSTLYESCPNNDFVYVYKVPSDRGGLNSLLRNARATRENIVPNDLPYPSIRTEIRKIYNHTALNIAPLVSIWVDYSQNFLYLSGFILFVGVVFPLVVVGLWTFWECCYESDDEEDEEEDNRNITLAAQVIAWSLACVILLLLVLLCIFVCILLAGNSWISTGVSEGGEVVGSVLPEMARIRDEALERVESLLVTDYEQLQLELYTDTLDLVPLRVKTAVRNDSETMETIDNFYENILSEIQSAQSLYQHSQLLTADLSTIASPPPDSILYMFLFQLNHTLETLTQYCVTIQTDNANSNSTLSNECERLMAIDRISLFPRTRHNITMLGGVGESGQPLLVQMDNLLSEVDNFNVSLGINVIDTFQDYLGTNLTTYLNESIKTVSEVHLGPSSNFNQNLETFVNSIVHFYNSTLIFGLPQSLTQLEEYLGPRYLTNWEVFRYACTVTFALIVLLLGVCLLVAVGRGLLNILAIYNGSDDDETNSEGAHQAGNMLKKVAFCFAGICIIASVFFGAFLSVSGVLGRVCGPNNNFSMAISNVIDHMDTWGGTFPLGWALIRNSSYPLTVQSVLDNCRQNHSLFESLQLWEKYDLSTITFSEAENIGYRDAMRAISTSIPLFEPLSPQVFTLLSRLNMSASIPVQWAEFHSLSAEQMFVEQFVGFDQLQQIIGSLEQALSETPTFDAGGLTSSNFSAILSSTEHALTNLSNYIDKVLLPQVNNSALALQEGQVASSASQLTNDIPSLSTTVGDDVIVKSRTELSIAFQTVSHQIQLFTSTSISTLQCQTGSCLSVARKFDQFTSSFCADVVPGLDVFWTTLIVILTLSLLILPLALVLASRFIDLELKKSMSKKFHLTSSVIRQCRATFWLFLSLSVCLWFTIAVGTDSYFQTMFCLNGGSGCCALCVSGFGAVFLLLAALVGGASRVYQCVIIHRITKCAHAKVKRFWVDRKKAIQFYTQLSTLLIQDVPFLILAGTYANGINTLTIPAFFTIVISLAGILSYIVYILQERGNILVYFTWLQKVCTSNSCYKKIQNQGEPTNPEGVANGQSNGGVPMATNRRRVGGRYGSSESEQSDDSQGTTQHDGDWHFTQNGSGVATGNHRLSNIPEQPEVVDIMNRGHPQLSPSPPHSYHPPTSPGSRGGRTLPQPIHVHQLDDNESYIELSQVQPDSTVVLDNFESVDHTNEAALQLRREAAIHQPMGGIEMASRHVDYETSTPSDFGSSYSMPVSEYPGYYSSQPPDDHYESSDYRDDYDSDYSQVHSQRNRHALRLNGMVGEVSMDV